jgi:hypothetical protein
MLETDPTVGEMIVRRLDVLIMLALDRVDGQEPAPISQKIHYLNGLGMRPVEIAGVVGKPTNYVTATLSKMKKAISTKAREAPPSEPARAD